MRFKFPPRPDIVISPTFDNSSAFVGKFCSLDSSANRTRQFTTVCVWGGGGLSPQERAKISREGFWVKWTSLDLESLARYGEGGG